MHTFAGRSPRRVTTFSVDAHLRRSIHARLVWERGTMGMRGARGQRKVMIH